jgi:serine incorporator 1/3
MFITVIIGHYGRGILDPFADYISCPAESGGRTKCLGVSAIYRMSFTLVIMFALIFLFLLCKNKFS